MQELLGTQATGGRGLHRQAGAGGLALYTWAGGAYAAHPPERRFMLHATYLQLPLPSGYTLKPTAARAQVLSGRQGGNTLTPPPSVGPQTRAIRQAAREAMRLDRADGLRVDG